MMERIDLKQIVAHKIQVEASAIAEGRTSLYNPLLQKPVALEPVGPGSYPAGLGGYAYIGPPADFGGSYGAYEDIQGNKQYGIKTSKQFSIYDGSPVQLRSELTSEEREALLSQMDDIFESAKCQSCRAELLVSAPIQAEKIHCPFCSTELEGAAEKVKQCYSKLEEKNMKSKIQAEADLAKEAMKVESPKEINEAAPEAKKAEMEDHKDADKAATMIKEADCGLEAKPKEVKSATTIQAAAKRRERIEAAKKAFEDKKKQRALTALKKKKAALKKPVKAQLNSSQVSALKKELRIMATFEPARFASLRRNPTLASICAEVASRLYTKAERAQVRAELSEMEERDPESAEVAKRELDFVAPEILMEQEGEAPVSMPSLEGMGEDHVEYGEDHGEHEEHETEQEEHEEHEAKKEESAAKEECETEECEDEALSMKTEFLASLSSLKGERVEMSLFAEETENPFWNVTIDAEPVGRIYLQDQESHDQIRAGFVSDGYANNFGQAVQQVGVEKMLNLTKARLFAHQADNKETMARVKAKALTEAKAQFDVKLQTLRQDFVKASQTALAASDKNLYQGEESAHALKGGLFTALANLSIEPNYAVWAIEAGFESAPQYFDFITQKAIEIMDMPKEARDSFENIVKASGKMELAGNQEPEEETLRDRLVKASHSAVAMGGMIGGEDKDLIRENLKLSPYRR